MRYSCFSRLRCDVVQVLIRQLSARCSVGDEGFTRSIYCKPQVVEVCRNGTPVKIRTGLIDRTSEPLGDQFTALQLKLTYKHDLDTVALIDWMRYRVKERNRQRQIVSDSAVQHLGLDLAVAHMICNVGGRVQFVGSDRWFQRYAGLSPGLPKKYVGDLKIESIDLSGTNVVYEGFELLPKLSELRYLRLRRCVHVDDHCMARVGRISSLRLLDIGECPRLTSKGIAVLSHLKSLRRLLVQGNPQMEDKELVCLMLEDHLSHLYIDGVEYLRQLPEESRQKIVAMISAGQENEAQQPMLQSSFENPSNTHTTNRQISADIEEDKIRKASI
ncbi:ATP synthase subunit s protein [Fasciola hepatica]|uniref:ATP synthase subunit s protein n=1 Tax=Fasciola hepatica TaxID=6192 RepID=A0A4E0R2Y5_FASHE|nr:ATP synthase subunit s protein [Fasciola hepatica]